MPTTIDLTKDEANYIDLTGTDGEETATAFNPQHQLAGVRIFLLPYRPADLSLDEIITSTTPSHAR